MILCTAGYKNYSFYQFKKMVEDLDALVIDVRYSPYTKLPFWGRQSLEENLCERYVHIREFGNRAYNQGEIEIDDFASGLTTFLDVTENANVVILLCACEEFEACHRKVVAEMLIEECDHIDRVDHF